MPAPVDDDDLLEAQLAHLDRIERRAEQLFGPDEPGAEAAAPAADAAGLAALLDATAERFPELPAPVASIAGYRSWLEAARARLTARSTHNGEELSRLSSQWIHISRNLTRFRPDEVAALVEAQARVRERLAADGALAELLTRAGAHLQAWEASRPALLAQAGAETVDAELGGEPVDAVGDLTGHAVSPDAQAPGPGGDAVLPDVDAAVPDATDDVTPTAGAGPAADVAPAPPADVELVRRLLDEASADRARSARALLESVLETLCTVVLDMEVVQRQVTREPHASAEVFRGLQDRLTAVVDDLRTLPDTDVIEPLPHEPLNGTLRRCVERHRARLQAEFAWSGGEAASDEVRRAATWVVEEFLSTASHAGASHAGVALGADAETLLLRLTATAALAADDAGVETGWILRCRARAAVAGGTLAVERAPDSCALELRFPIAAPAGYGTSGDEPPERRR